MGGGCVAEGGNVARLAESRRGCGEMTKQFCMGISCLTYEILYANSRQYSLVRRHNKRQRRREKYYEF